MRLISDQLVAALSPATGAPLAEKEENAVCRCEAN